MRGDGFNTDEGTTMAGLLALSPRQRNIVNWIRREKREVTLAEIATHFQQDEAPISGELNFLVQEGFLQTNIVEGETFYSRKLGVKQGSRIQEIFEQSLSVGKPLVIIVNPSGEMVATAGSTVELGVTVSNQGNQSALIDIAIDETSEFVYQWCRSPYERLALGPGQTSEVFFQFDVPTEGLPDAYNYLLKIDAQEHYPEHTPILNPGRLRVIPFIQETQTVNDPTFSIVPSTSSVQPAIFEGAEPLAMQAIVRNRTDRVDRFRLSCPDFGPDWVNIKYPEGLQELGLIVANTGLELNPGEQGEIEIFFQPPPGTLAGVYSPTLRLYSSNNPSLALLDVVYLQVPGVYVLDIELVTIVGTIRNEAGVFELRLHNRGNTPREVKLQAREVDGGKACTYTLAPEQLQLSPGESAKVELEVKPQKSWWRRPFYGRTINFEVEVEDLQQLPLINSRFQATLVWQGRPWWHFLLIALGIVGVVAALILLIWWLLRPKPLPQIVEFTPDSSTYREANDDVVSLSWRIDNPKRIKSLQISGVSPDGLLSSEPIVYNFKDGIPDELQGFCEQVQELVCQNVPTDARKAGDYVFELTLVPKSRKKGTVQKEKTSAVRITGIPVPKVLEFASTEPQYKESQTITVTPTEPQEEGGEGEGEEAKPIVRPSPGIRLNWKIGDADQIKELKLVGKAPDGSVTSKERTFKFDSISPQKLAKLCTQEENASQALCKRGKNIKQLVELCESNETQILCQNARIPPGLDRFCVIVKLELICQSVPTGASKAGSYVFELTPVPKEKPKDPIEPATTDTIKVIAQPVPFEIVEFNINGVEAQPKYSVPINKEEPTPIIIDWKVVGGKDIKVELLPSPGTVEKEGKATYPLGKEPGSETIILQVTNAEGEQKSRSVTIESFLPKEEVEEGADGAEGENGADGEEGQDGAQGEEGADGANGEEEGKDGASESEGEKGSEEKGGDEEGDGRPPALPEPPGASPPIPPGRNSPPPVDLPPAIR